MWCNIINTFFLQRLTFDSILLVWKQTCALYIFILLVIYKPYFRSCRYWMEMFKVNSASIKRSLCVCILWLAVFIVCQLIACSWLSSWSWGHFKNTYELLSFHLWIKYTSSNVWVGYFVWNFKGHLWNSTQNIIPIHWNIQFLWNI